MSLLHLTIHSVGEGTTQVITGAVMLIYNLGQQLQLIVYCRIPQLQTSYANRQSTTPHKIVTRLWLAVWKWYTRFLIYKKWSIWWNNTRLQPAASIHSSRRFSHRRKTITTAHFLNKQCIGWFHKISYLSRTQTSSCWVTTSDNILTRKYWIPRIRTWWNQSTLIPNLP